MKPDSLPVIGEILDAGPNDRAFDSLLLVGPLLIVAVALFGRSIVTVLLAAGYLVAFVGYTLSKAVSS